MFGFPADGPVSVPPRQLLSVSEENKDRNEQQRSSRVFVRKKTPPPPSRCHCPPALCAPKGGPIPGQQTDLWAESELPGCFKKGTGTHALSGLAQQEDGPFALAPAICWLLLPPSSLLLNLAPDPAPRVRREQGPGPAVGRIPCIGKFLQRTGKVSPPSWAEVSHSPVLHPSFVTC